MYQLCIELYGWFFKFESTMITLFIPIEVHGVINSFSNPNTFTN